MRTYSGRIAAVNLFPGGQLTAWIDCPPSAIPGPGQFVSAWPVDLSQAPLAASLFLVEAAEGRFLGIGDIPAEWQPGMELHLRGPIGRSFALPEAARRISLAALGESTGPLVPLMKQALDGGCAVALFTGAPLPRLPWSVEAFPLSELPMAPRWADYLALNGSPQSLLELRASFGLAPGERMPCPAQILISIPMPCAALAECGACAVPARRGWKLACTGGPVFDLEELDW